LTTVNDLVNGKQGKINNEEKEIDALVFAEDGTVFYSNLSN
jgi:hypothetical protein